MGKYGTHRLARCCRRQSSVEITQNAGNQKINGWENLDEVGNPHTKKQDTKCF